MSNSYYSKTKSEHIKLLEYLIDKHGDEYILYLNRVNQGDTHTMYTTTLSVAAAFSFIKRLPRDYTNPEGLQRGLKESKVSNIAEEASKESYSQPNSTVLSLFPIKEELKSIITIQAVTNIDQLLMYRINLHKYLELLESAETNEKGYIINEDNLFLGVLIDSHHRLEGLFRAQRFDFEVPTTAYMNLPMKEIYKIFIGINKYQEKPSNVHTLSIEQLSGILVGEAEQSARIINLLNTDFGNSELSLGMDKNSDLQPKTSILFDRIKTVDVKRPYKARKTYITNSTMDKLLKENFFENVNPDIQVDIKAEILNNYFLAWSECFPEAWNDDKKHVLVKSMGFQIMMKLFPIIYVSLAHSGIPNKEQFENFIKKNLVNQEIDLNGFPIKLDWSSQSFGAYSSGKGINQLAKVLKSHITSKTQTI